jgi:hypothetical protein
MSLHCTTCRKYIYEGVGDGANRFVCTECGGNAELNDMMNVFTGIASVLKTIIAIVVLVSLVGLFNSCTHG